MTPLAPNKLIARLPPADRADFIKKLETIFKAMDEAYRASAEKSGFVCRGCDDNCCQSLFYHYTLLEYAYLQKGLKGLSQKDRDQIFKRAEERATNQTGRTKAMCPLNKDGACFLYTYRPMICRLHGIPHLLRSPAGKILTGPGCDDFLRQCGSVEADRLDRTPFYRKISALENELRQAVKANLKLKMTIAQMIVQLNKEDS